MAERDTALVRALMDALRETRANRTRTSARKHRRRHSIERHHIAETGGDASTAPSGAVSA